MADILEELRAENAKLRYELNLAKHEIEINDRLLAERDATIVLIPECPVHGVCLPHAREWIAKAKAVFEAASKSKDLAHG